MPKVSHQILQNTVKLCLPNILIIIHISSNFLDIYVFNMSISKTLKIFNKKGSILAFTNYGASLKSWNFELNENKKVDVVLGYGDEINYKSNPLYLGCIAGRYANRIAKGKFRLGGMQISLAKVK